MIRVTFIKRRSTIPVFTQTTYLYLPCYGLFTDGTHRYRPVILSLSTIEKALETLPISVDKNSTPLVFQFPQLTDKQTRYSQLWEQLGLVTEGYRVISLSPTLSPETRTTPLLWREQWLAPTIYFGCTLLLFICSGLLLYCAPEVPVAEEERALATRHLVLLRNLVQREESEGALISCSIREGRIFLQNEE